MKLLLQPRHSIGPILLGMPRDAVRAACSAMGCPFESERGRLDYFLDAVIQVEYQEDHSASFIGIASDKRVDLIFGGVDLFDLDAEEVFRRFAQLESGCHTYNNCEYLFPDQIITLYEADKQYDRKRGRLRPVWGQIGIGDTRYYSP